MKKQPQKIFRRKSSRRNWWVTFVLTAISISSVSFSSVLARADDEEIKISASFTEREIAPLERIELTLSRPLRANEGRLAVFIGKTDISALFVFEDQSLTYQPTFEPFPIGENQMTVYLIEPVGNWKALAEFALKVKSEESTASISEEAMTAESSASNESSFKSKSGKTKVEFMPNASLNVKGQNQTLTFPRESAPERNPFTDLAGQGAFQLKISRGGWSLGNQFNFAGSSFQREALRFGELGARAPRIDLSSYMVELGKGRFKINLGHVFFGSNRHLVNSFSSRGITVTVPISKQNEVSFAAMNGTSIVGFDNFLGITRRKHSVVGLRFAREFSKEQPGRLRVEFSAMRGSLLPLSNFNQGEVNDAEKSLGFGLKVTGSDWGQRLRYEVGYTRSRFTNPPDPFLEQGFNVTKIRPVWRPARYGEISFDFLQGLKLWKEKKLKLTGTYRHEEIKPLYRSVVAFTQADRRQNQFEVSASFGEINFVYGNLRDRDNLNNIASILKTLNRRSNMNFAVALNSFFTPSKPKKWLPQVSYSFDHVHQFGAFLPTNGDFRELSQVPDQHNFVHSFNAQWQLSDKFNIGYRYNRAFQDNHQPGRELSDFQSYVNAVSFGTKPHNTIDLNFDLSREQQKSFEQPRTDRTFRLGTRAMWRTPFLKNSTFSGGFSTTLAGDTNNFNDSRNAELDVQWAYRFSFGKEKFKKTEAQFFIRYANRYGDVRDRLFFFNNFNKTQAFNFGLNFNIF